jgi:nucleoside-diphosphate-sugar epimerase
VSGDKTLVVTGGTGFLGRGMLGELVDTFPGQVISINRTPLSDVGLHLAPPHLEVRADIRDHRRWHRYLAEADYVLWLAALRDHGATAATSERENVDPLRGALRAMARHSGFKRLIFASSISALDQPRASRRPLPINDTSPASPRTPYGYSKLMSERVIASSGVPHTILRFPFLYGPGFRRGSFLDFYRAASKSPILSAACYTGTLSLLYTGDVASIVSAVLTAPSSVADASPYVVSDGRTYLVDDLISLVGEEYGLGRPRIRVPAAASRSVSAMAMQAHRYARSRPIPRGWMRLQLAYWSHAAFTPGYFVVDSSRFRSAFPGCAFTAVEIGIREALGATL